MSITQQNKSFLGIGIGIVLIVVSGLYLVYKQTILSFNSAGPQIKISERRSSPSKLVIDELKINIPLDRSSIKDGNWQISAKNGSYLDLGAYPGENGNIIIYGHNKFEILGRLKNASAGDMVKVITQDGKEHLYKINKTMVVSPDDIEVVKQKDEETLTIYTCTGLFDSKRFVVIASPIDSLL